MTTPDPFYGPFDTQPQPYWLPTPRRRALLGRALRGVPLGTYDRGVLDWLADQDTGVVRVVASLVERTREQQQPARRVTPPPRQVVGQPRSDVEAIAMAVRQLADLDIYSLFMEAQRVRPSSLTGLVWRRAEQTQQRPGRPPDQ